MYLFLQLQTNEQIELLKQQVDLHKHHVEELELHIMEFSDSRRTDSDNFRQVHFTSQITQP